MIKAIAIQGPTASGKTALSLDLAQRFSMEIISCDSMQIYKDMDIGTAKPTPAERSLVKHHLIDFLSPTESYSTERYRREALQAAADISSRGKIPLFVGGTGLYLDTLMRAEQSEVPESSPEYRERELSKIKSPEDTHALWERLKRCDPESAEKIHENNVRRVIRALEIYELTGKPKSYFDKLSQQRAKDIDIFVISLDFHDRENLYRRIDERVDAMMREGLLEEVRALYEKGLLSADTTAAQAIGYKELIEFVKGNAQLPECIETLKQSSRRYAKRQLTWFRHVDSEKIMLDRENGDMLPYDEILLNASNLLEKYLKKENLI